MSIQSTHVVTREFALTAIQYKLQSCTDEQIENILQEVIHNGFYNFNIVSETELEEVKESGPYALYIDNLHNLPE